MPSHSVSMADGLVPPLLKLAEWKFSISSSLPSMLPSCLPACLILSPFLPACLFPLLLSSPNRSRAYSQAGKKTCTVVPDLDVMFHLSSFPFHIYFFLLLHKICDVSPGFQGKLWKELNDLSLFQYAAGTWVHHLVMNKAIFDTFTPVMNQTQICFFFLHVYFSHQNFFWSFSSVASSPSYILSQWGISLVFFFFFLRLSC